MDGHHLAQLNIGRFRYTLDDPRMAEFVNNLDLVNEIAEQSEGFVWRLKDDAGNATSFVLPGETEMAVNLSVWESVEALERFVWMTVHQRFYRRQESWFIPLDAPHFVMWWVPEGHRPSLEEAKAKLDYLAEHGPSEAAFGWETARSAKLWREKRCS